MKEYKLEIDPRILELLGPSLYTNIYYVLAELIANAYDADAKNVYITANADDITVEDDGHGMSYEAGDVNRYLNVAAASRVSAAEARTRSGKRCRMGRKGVGKLAALSVSENVDVMTKHEHEVSGFVLSRHPDAGNFLRPIPDAEVKFTYITGNGSRIVMRQPEYRLDRSLDAVKRNLLKLFPLADADFRVHIIRGRQRVVVDCFDKHIMGDLCCLITLGTDFAHLRRFVPALYPKKHGALVEARDSAIIPLTMRDTGGTEREYSLEITGWIGTYKTTRGRKAKRSDFPDNFISLFANKKMGEFNILPAIGQNKLNEVYVVGQLHVDLFELTDLPDMALSNRQGYKTDDPRYEAALDFVRDELLAEILRKRETFTDLAGAEKKRRKLDDQRRREAALKAMVDKFRDGVVKDAARGISERMGDSSKVPRAAIERIIADAINSKAPDLGLKCAVDALKRRVLISQTRGDKPFADIVYQMLLHNGLPYEHILYTNCDNEDCRVPEGMHIYDYLREFFVESYSTEKIFVLFITSMNMKQSWGALTEVGAAWITQVGHKIFNVHPFRPEHPLNDEAEWQSTYRKTPTSGELWMSPLEADKFCQKIEAVCDRLGYAKRGRVENVRHLGTLVAVRDEE